MSPIEKADKIILKFISLVDVRQSVNNEAV